MRAVVRQRLPDRPVDQGRHQPTNGWYGGTLPKRLRFLVEVTEAVTRAWSPDRVGVRLSPVADYNDMKDNDPLETFSEAARELDPLAEQMNMKRLAMAAHDGRELGGRAAAVASQRLARILSPKGAQVAIDCRAPLGGEGSKDDY